MCVCVCARVFTCASQGSCRPWRQEGRNCTLHPCGDLYIFWNFLGLLPPGCGWQPCLAELQSIPCLPPTGFANVLKILNKDSSREELLSFIQQFGSHYIAEALYGSEFSCTIHFPSKKVQQQLWLQYQKGEEGGGKGQGYKCQLLFMLFSTHEHHAHTVATLVSGCRQETCTKVSAQWQESVARVRGQHP